MQLSLSYICDRPYNIYQSYEKLKPHYDMSVHMDFMDGHFVPRLGVHPEAVDELSYPSHIDAHCMIASNNPAWGRHTTHTSRCYICTLRKFPQ